MRVGVTKLRDLDEICAFPMRGLIKRYGNNMEILRIFVIYERRTGPPVDELSGDERAFCYRDDNADNVSRVGVLFFFFFFNRLDRCVRTRDESRNGNFAKKIQSGRRSSCTFRSSSIRTVKKKEKNTGRSVSSISIRGDTLRRGHGGKNKPDDDKLLREPDNERKLFVGSMITRTCARDRNEPFDKLSNVCFAFFVAANFFAERWKSNPVTERRKLPRNELREFRAAWSVLNSMKKNCCSTGCFAICSANDEGGFILFENVDRTKDCNRSFFRESSFLKRSVSRVLRKNRCE